MILFCFVDGALCPRFWKYILLLQYFLSCHSGVLFNDDRLLPPLLLFRFKVHERGSLYASPDELLRQVTGEDMQPRALVDHLCSKYSELYGLK